MNNIKYAVNSILIYSTMLQKFGISLETIAYGKATSPLPSAVLNQHSKNTFYPYKNLVLFMSG